MGRDRVVEQARPALRRPGPAYAAVALVVLAAAPYIGGVSHPFVYDDIAQVARNELVRTLDPRSALSHGAVTHGRVEWYRPLTIYTLAANHAVSGLAPRSYHLVNIVIHAANAVLLFSIGELLLISMPAAFAAAALFAVHAVHTEAVAPIFGRADLLAAFFVLAAWRIALGSYEASRTRTVTVITLFAAGLLAKENALALVPVIALSDAALRLRRGTVAVDLAVLLRQRRSLYASLAGGVMAYGLLRYAMAGGLFAEGSHVRYLENPLIETNPIIRVLTALWVTVKYLALFVVPHPLSADYSYNQIPLVQTATDLRVLAVGLLLAALFGAWRVERRAPRTLLLVGAFACLFLPVSNVIVPIGTIMAERLFYLPSSALCLLFGLWLAYVRADAGARARTAAAAVVTVAIAGNAIASVARVRDWSSEERLFAATVRTSPGSAKARFNYAAVLAESNRPLEARAMAESAVAIASAYPEAQNLLGTLALADEDLPRAAAAFEAALRDAPDYAPALANLGAVRRREGRLSEARRLLERAITADPSMAVAHVNLALVAELQGDRAVALVHYRRAYALDSSLDVARQRADALDRRGRS